MRDFLPFGEYFGATIWIGFTLADIAFAITTPAWQGRHGGPAGALSALGLVLGLLYARWRFRGVQQ